MPDPDPDWNQCGSETLPIGTTYLNYNAWCFGSVTFWHGSGSLDSYTKLRILLFSSVWWVSRWQKKYFLFCFLLITHYRFINISLQRYQVIKKSPNSTNQGFFLIFLLFDGRIRSRSRIQEAQKVHIRIRNTMLSQIWYRTVLMLFVERISLIKDCFLLVNMHI